MPSSLIWIALVAGWVLVLFPMVAGRRMPVSRTGSATEETRVLHRGGRPRPARRGPAVGHLSDPEWQPSPEQEQARRGGTHSGNPKSAPVEAQMDSPATDSDDRNYMDADLDAADAGKVDAGKVDAAESVEFASRGTLVLDAVVVGEEDAPEEAVDEAAAEDRVDEDQVEADRVDADSVSEVVAEDQDDTILATVPVEVPVERSGRGGFDPDADAAARAIRYRNRQRTMLGLAGVTVLSIVGSIIFSSLFLWVALLSGLLLAGYMGYLRQQVRMEHQIRERRMARLQRSRRDAVAERRAVHTVPDAARRYGAVVLEADDEDPYFEHLPHYESSVRSQETQAAG